MISASLKSCIFGENSCIFRENGVDERKTSLFFFLGKPCSVVSNDLKSLWSKSVNTACSLINRMPFGVLGNNYPSQTILPGFPVDSIPLRVFVLFNIVHYDL